MQRPIKKIKKTDVEELMRRMSEKERRFNITIALLAHKDIQRIYDSWPLGKHTETGLIDYALELLED